MTLIKSKEVGEKIMFVCFYLCTILSDRLVHHHLIYKKSVQYK